MAALGNLIEVAELADALESANSLKDQTWMDDDTLEEMKRVTLSVCLTRHGGLTLTRQGGLSGCAMANKRLSGCAMANKRMDKQSPQAGTK